MSVVFLYMCEWYNYFQELCNTYPVRGDDLYRVKIYSRYNINKMNQTEAKGNWNEQKGRLKQKFAVLTDNDLMYKEGKKDEMLGKLQIKLGKSKEELQKILAGL